ncbi:MAG: hypothetical protein IKV86_08285 [Clostridia bacterium]|nr:hypothetical protein [Clostridia bacterium]
MKKYLVAFLVCMIMLLNTLGVFAYEYTPYIGDGAVSATLFDVVYESVTVEGEVETVTEVESIDDATRVSASCMVKPGLAFESEVKVMMIIAGYKDDCLLDYGISTTPVYIRTAEDGAQKVSASLDIGTNDFDDIEVFIWDDMDNAKPLLNYGNAIDAEDGLDAVIIGGARVALDEETKTGTVTVNAGYVEWPDIMVVSKDLASKVSVDVKGTFPLSKPVHSLVNANTEVEGESKEATATITVGSEVYTITVTQETPQITDVLFREFKDMSTGEPTYYTDEQVKIQYDIQNPVWTDELPGPHKEIIGGTADNFARYNTGLSAIEYASAAYSNNPKTNSGLKMILMDINPELLGAQSITIPFTSGVTNTTYPDDCYTFTIDRSARIYVQNTAKTLDSSWTLAESRFQKDAGMKKVMYYELRSSATSNSITYAVGNSVYYKDYYVEPGEKCTITLPGDKAMPKVFIKYKDTQFVTNAKYTLADATNATDAETIEVVKPAFADPDFATGKYKFYLHGSTTSTADIYGTGNLMYCTSTFLDDTSTRSGYGLAVVPDELVGGTAIITPFTASTMEEISFDISTSARVYIFTTASSSGRLAKLLEALGEGWENTSITHGDANLDDKDIAIAYRSSDSAINENMKNSRSFYKDFIVQPDDSMTVTLTLSTYGLEGQKMVVIIKPLEE